MNSAIAAISPAVDRRDVWCAIPVYNNATTIHDVALRCRQQLPCVMVIDDGSSDADLHQVLQDLDVTLVRHERNLGKGRAILTALRHASGQGAAYVITLDGDGQHYPEDIGQFLDRVAPDTIVVGERRTVEGEMPSSSRFGREFSDFWIHAQTGESVADTQSGFRVYPVQGVLDLALRCRRYDFEVEVITRALWAGMRVEQAPIRVWYPPARDRVSSFRPFLDNVRLSITHARLVLRRLVPWGAGRSWATGPSRSGARSLWREHATPLGLAAAAATGAFIAGMPLPWLQPLLVLYVALRLHLNKPLAVATGLLSLMPQVARWSIALGRHMHPGEWGGWPPLCVLGWPAVSLAEWFLGSLVLCPLMAIAAAILTYQIARRVRLRRDKVEQADEYC